jgi:hypothetical protein
MTSLTTPEMVEKAKLFLATQTESTPRDILQTLHDYAVSLLGTDNPPNPATVTGEITVTTTQIIELVNKKLDEYSGLSPYDFLVQVRNGALWVLQQLPKWRCSMFFPGGSWPNNHGVGSSLNFANIDSTCPSTWRKFMCDSVRTVGGDTLLFIAEKLLNNPTLWAEVDGYLTYAANIGMKHVIFDLKNDNNNVTWENTLELARQIKARYPWANSDMVAVMTCLETDEITDVNKTISLSNPLKEIVGTWRVIVGSQKSDFLKTIAGGCAAELWLEIHTNPFNLSQADADKYISDLQSLLPYGPVWAGEFWDGSSALSKYISRRALEIGCAGVGSWVG